MLAAAVVALVLAGAARAEADIGDDDVGGERTQHAEGKAGPKQGDMMVLYAAAGFFLVMAAGIGKWAASQGHDAPKPAAAGGRRAAADEAEAAGGGAARRTALARMRARRQAGAGDDSDGDEDNLDAGGKKIGAKKLAKLEQKEEKRAYREAMEEEKARRREKQEKDEEEARERRQAELDKEKAEAEAEAKRIAEIKKKEEEEFDKWKDMFETGEDGAQADDDLQENQVCPAADPFLVAVVCSVVTT
jgi:hypothetical protein